LSFEKAAALPMRGGAALAALDTLALSPGDTLLVVGATGGVGSYAVQLAKGRRRLRRAGRHGHQPVLLRRG
jgi:NADPH:quinone reductase-like Zn-dependent oxidoreductase